MGKRIDTIISKVENNIGQSKFLTEDELVEMRIVRDIDSLKEMRENRTGPCCVKIGKGDFRYGRSELISWLKISLQTKSIKELRIIYSRLYNIEKEKQILECKEKYNTKNSIKLKEDQKKYRENNFKKIKAWNREDYKKNAEQINQKARERRLQKKIEDWLGVPKKVSGG